MSRGNVFVNICFYESESTQFALNAFNWLTYTHDSLFVFVVPFSFLSRNLFSVRFVVAFLYFTTSFWVFGSISFIFVHFELEKHFNFD